MLSKNESKYRIKIMAENHLRKDGQKYLDQYVKNRLLTYKKVYLDYGLRRSILAQYHLSKFSNAMQHLGISCAQATESIQALSTTFRALLRPLGDYEKCTYLKR